MFSNPIRTQGSRWGYEIDLVPGTLLLMTSKKLVASSKHSARGENTLYSDSLALQQYYSTKVGDTCILLDYHLVSRRKHSEINPDNQRQQFIQTKMYWVNGERVVYFEHRAYRFKSFVKDELYHMAFHAKLNMDDDS